MAMTTAMYYPPTYDKHGNNLNPDGNITSGDVSCSVCGKKWYYSSRYGKTDFKEMNNG
jgi:hypothetical protein